MQFADPTKFSKPDPEEVSPGGEPSNTDALVASISADTENAQSNIEAKKLEPTRFGDWERNGRCIDF